MAAKKARGPLSGTITTNQLAKLLRITEQWVRTLVRDGFIPRARNADGKELTGRFELVPAIHGYLDYRSKLTDEQRSMDEEMFAEKLRKMAASRELEEIKLQTAKGQLHHKRDVEVVFGAMLSRLRVQLLALPQGCAPLLLGQEDENAVAAILADRLNQALRELSEFNLTAFEEYQCIVEPDEQDEDDSPDEEGDADA